MHLLSENVKFDYEYAGGTLNNSATTAVYYSMHNYDAITFIIYTGMLTGAASLSIQGWQRVGSAGAEAVIGTSPTVSTADDTITLVEFKAADMTVSSGYDRIGLVITGSGTANAVILSVVAARYRARYGQATLPA
jgi:hypothetical protein